MTESPKPEPIAGKKRQIEEITQPVVQNPQKNLLQKQTFAGRKTFANFKMRKLSKPPAQANNDASALQNKSVALPADNQVGIVQSQQLAVNQSFSGFDHFD